MKKVFIDLFVFYVTAHIMKSEKPMPNGIASTFWTS